MGTRNTQTTKALLVEPVSAGGAARVTQTTKALLLDTGTPQAGGAARVTQLSLVIVGTRPLAGGGFMLRGIGS